MADDPPPIVRRERRAVYENAFVTVYDDEVEFPGGRRGTYLRVVEAGGQAGACVLARCGDTVALVQVFRYPIDAWEWGFPRGFAHGDDPAATACTELYEELGAEPDELGPLGVMNPNSGLLASTVHLYVARYATPVARPYDSAEVREVRWVPVPELMADIAAGRIVDGFTLATVGLAVAAGVLKP
jgi:8-oxo-dGTP pyrophosphatase MutT (NUDIX family)